MAMASKRRLKSTADIELRVVVKFCVELKLSPVEILKQSQNAPVDRAHDTELDIDLLSFNLPPHLPYSPDLGPRHTKHHRVVFARFSLKFYRLPTPRAS